MPDTEKENFVERHLQRVAKPPEAENKLSLAKHPRRYKHTSALSAAMCLDQYRDTGQGEKLVTAYVAWRDATRDETTSRKKRLIKDFQAGVEKSMVQLETDSTELLGLEILGELDAVVEDLRRTFQGMRAKNKHVRSDLLTQLRSALRIDDGHEPSKTLLEDQRRIHVDLFLNRYSEMQGTYIYKSDTAIAKEVAGIVETNAAAFGLPSAKGWETVLEDWKDFLANDPVQQERVKLIQDIARISRVTPKSKAKPLRQVTPVREPTPAKSIRPKNTKKPAAWKRSR